MLSGCLLKPEPSEATSIKSYNDLTYLGIGGDLVIMFIVCYCLYKRKTVGNNKRDDVKSETAVNFDEILNKKTFFYTKYKIEFLYYFKFQ